MTGVLGNHVSTRLVAVGVGGLRQLRLAASCFRVSRHGSRPTEYFAVVLQEQIRGA